MGFTISGDIRNESSTWEELSEYKNEDIKLSLDAVNEAEYLAESLITLQSLTLSVYNPLGEVMEIVELNNGEEIAVDKYSGIVILMFETSDGLMFSKKIITLGNE